MLPPMRADRAELLLASIKRYKENKLLPRSKRAGTHDEIQINLEQIRIAAGLSISKLSIISGVAKGYISELETDTYDNPSIRVLCKLKKALECTLDELVSCEEDGNGNKDLHSRRSSGDPES